MWRQESWRHIAGKKYGQMEAQPKELDMDSDEVFVPL